MHGQELVYSASVHLAVLLTAVCLRHGGQVTAAPLMSHRLVCTNVPVAEADLFTERKLWLSEGTGSFVPDLPSTSSRFDFFFNIVKILFLALFTYLIRS